VLARIPAAAVMLTALTVLALGASPANATSTLTGVVVVPCNQTTPSTSMLDVPQGWLLVTVVGACDYHASTNPDTITTVNTPCSYGNVQNIPCVTNQPITQPAAACAWSAHYVASTCDTGNPFLLLPCGGGTVKVDGQCVQPPGLVYHIGNGPVSAVYTDTAYSDNLGYFIVIFQWTPL
jgi:hypothetical protein